MRVWNLVPTDSFNPMPITNKLRTRPCTCHKWNDLPPNTCTRAVLSE